MIVRRVTILIIDQGRFPGKLLPIFFIRKMYNPPVTGVPSKFSFSVIHQVRKLIGNEILQVI